MTSHLDEWKELEVVDGSQQKSYYHNTKTGDVSWNIPSTDWRKVRLGGGKVYFINALTQATCWNPPDETKAILDQLESKGALVYHPPQSTDTTSPRSLNLVSRSPNFVPLTSRSAPASGTSTPVKHSSPSNSPTASSLHDSTPPTTPPALTLPPLVISSPPSPLAFSTPSSTPTDDEKLAIKIPSVSPRPSPPTSPLGQDKTLVFPSISPSKDLSESVSGDGYFDDDDDDDALEVPSGLTRARDDSTSSTNSSPEKSSSLPKAYSYIGLSPPSPTSPKSEDCFDLTSVPPRSTKTICKPLKSMAEKATFSDKKSGLLKRASGFRKEFKERYFSVYTTGVFHYFRDKERTKKAGQIKVAEAVVTQIDKTEGEWLFTVRDSTFHVLLASSKRDRDEWLFVFQDHGADVRPILMQGLLYQISSSPKDRLLRFCVLYKKKFQWFSKRSDDQPAGEIDLPLGSAARITTLSSKQCSETELPVSATQKFMIIGSGSAEFHALSLDDEMKWLGLIKRLMAQKMTRQIVLEIFEGKNFRVTDHLIYCSVMVIREEKEGRMVELRQELQKTELCAPPEPTWNCWMNFHANLPERGCILVKVKFKGRKTLGSNSLGEVVIPFDFRVNSGRSEKWYDLKARKVMKSTEAVGQIRIAMKLTQAKKVYSTLTAPPGQSSSSTMLRAPLPSYRTYSSNF